MGILESERPQGLPIIHREIIVSWSLLTADPASLSPLVLREAAGAGLLCLNHEDGFSFWTRT